MNILQSVPSAALHHGQSATACAARLGAAKRGSLSLRNLSALTIVMGASLCASAVRCQPVLIGGSISEPFVKVRVPPASPVVRLEVNGPVDLATLHWTGPSGEGFDSSFDTDGLPSNTGKIALQAYLAANPSGALAGTPFTAYSEAGTWTLGAVTLCVRTPTLSCNSYIGAQLTPLFTSTSIKVVNPDTPDFQPPTVTGATIRTPVISISKGPAILIDFNAQDNASGVGNAFIQANQNGGGGQIMLFSPGPTSPTLAHLYTVTAPVPETTPAGTYTISLVEVQDAAGNAALFSTADSISKLFHKKVTIAVNP